MIMNKFPKKGVPSSGRGGWVDPTWDKVLNSTGFFLEGFPYMMKVISLYEKTPKMFAYPSQPQK